MAFLEVWWTQSLRQIQPSPDDAGLTEVQWMSAWHCKHHRLQLYALSGEEEY